MMYRERADERAGEAAESDVLIFDETAHVADAVKAMREKRVASVLVSAADAKEPVGIVTERDVLYRVVAENRGPFKTTLKEIMTSPIITIDEATTVKEAVVLMRKHDIRRLPVTKGGKIVGMLTLQSLIGDSHEKSIDLIDVEGRMEKVMCPYCGSKFENKQDLSRHVDRLHLGSGLLEGDLRQW